MEKVIRLLEHEYEGVAQKGVSKERPYKMYDSLDVMKRKLELVQKAEEKALKEMGGPRSALMVRECYAVSAPLISSAFLYISVF